MNTASGEAVGPRYGGSSSPAAERLRADDRVTPCHDGVITSRSATAYDSSPPGLRPTDCFHPSPGPSHKGRGEGRLGPSLPLVGGARKGSDVSQTLRRLV
jgi:hypothetical protein